MASSRPIVVGSVGLPSARSRLDLGGALLQRRIGRVDGQREAGIGQRVFVAAIDRGFERQRRQLLQRMEHHRRRAFEQPAAAQRKQRVGGEQRCSTPGIDRRHGRRCGPASRCTAIGLVAANAIASTLADRLRRCPGSSPLRLPARRSSARISASARGSPRHGRHGDGWSGSGRRPAGALDRRQDRRLLGRVDQRRLAALRRHARARRNCRCRHMNWSTRTAIGLSPFCSGTIDRAASRRLSSRFLESAHASRLRLAAHEFRHRRPPLVLCLAARAAGRAVDHHGAVLDVGQAAATSGWSAWATRCPGWSVSAPMPSASSPSCRPRKAR